MGEFLKKLFGTAAGEGIKATTGLLGSQGFMDLLGSEGMSNLITGGGSLMEALSTGDMLDFQKDKANNMERKSDILFDDQMATREKRKGAFDGAVDILGF